MNLSDWPVLDILDFSGVEFDVMKWSEDDSYTLMINFYSHDSEKPDENTGGMTWCMQTSSESLEEMSIKINMMIELGFFDQLEISGKGTLWNQDGDQIGEINWNEITESALDSVDEDDISESEEKPEDPLHHRPIKTLQ